MAHLVLDGVSKRYGDHQALRGLSVEVAQGERLALLGPSGCGKTTALSLVAGFLQPDTGRIAFDGRDMADVPVHRRDIGMVFQSYALFPHRTVAENIAFGLRMRKVAKTDHPARVTDALALVRLQGLGDRYPRQLSGGQQQRVALARALVTRPGLLLLDEPLSNLDARLRLDMQTELVDILTRVGITTIFVTHDQAEALAVSDRVAIMHAGRLQQVGTPAEVYDSPATGFVARFLGESNVLVGTVGAVTGGRTRVDLDGFSAWSEQGPGLKQGETVELVLRVERIILASAAEGGTNCFAARVERAALLGGAIRYGLRIGGHTLTAMALNDGQRAVHAAGDMVALSFRPADALLMRVAPGEANTAG